MMQRDKNLRERESFTAIRESNKPTRNFTAQCGFVPVNDLWECSLCCWVSSLNESLLLSSTLTRSSAQVVCTHE